MVSQAEQLAATVAALDTKPEHAALIAACEGIAEALDQYPTRATLWQQYLPTLLALYAAAEVEADDGEGALLRIVSTPVGNETKPGKSDAGSGSRRAREASDPDATVDAVAATGRGRRTGTSS